MRNSMDFIAKHVGDNGSSSFSTPMWDRGDVSGNAIIVFHNLGGYRVEKDRNNDVLVNFWKSLQRHRGYIYFIRRLCG